MRFLEGRRDRHPLRCCGRRLGLQLRASVTLTDPAHTWKSACESEEESKVKERRKEVK